MWNQLLQSIARQASKKGKLPEATPELLRQLWPALVGDDIARLSSPEKLEGSTLHVQARHPNLVRDWKSHPMPLLRKIRTLSPWTVDRLQISHNPEAGIRPDDDQLTEMSTQKDADLGVAEPEFESPRAEGADPDLKALIDSISRHRKRRE